MWGALGDTFAVAMGLALSPIAITTALILLLAPRGRLRATMFAVGWFAAMFVITVIPAWITDDVDESDPVGTDEGIDILHLAFGALFLVLAVVTWTKRPASDRPADDRTDGAEPKRGVLSRLDDFGVWTCLAIGFGEGVVIIKNLPLAISAGTRLGSAGLSSTHLVVTVVLFAALSSTTVVIPLVASIVGGDRVERPLYDARAWIEKHMTAITLVVLVVVGFIFLGEGLDLAD